MSLLKYVTRRVLYMIPMAIGISIISFLIMYAAGDPIKLAAAGHPNITESQREALRRYYGLDQPIPIQYLNWLSHLLVGDFGRSLYGGRPVNSLIGDWLWETIKLSLIGTLLALAIAIPVGVNSALKQYSLTDAIVTTSSIFGVSMPTFWIGIVLILVFSFWLGWLPSSGAYGFPKSWPLFGIESPIVDAIAHLILPVAVLTYVEQALYVRLTRSQMLEVMRQDYILAAKASGLPEGKITYKYALRNAITPVITYAGIAIGGIVGGAPMTETVFSWPGLGRRFVEAATLLDFPVVMGITMIITVMVLIANLIVDISYAFLDPRISVE
ncbi:MAG TPA: ABC transporter permease [Thermoproteota archaeon]|nr:ABC transporter permease [Thermoproteota archaeon]